MNIKTIFNILGIDSEASELQAKRAYKAQVRRWHPDQFPEGSITKAGAEEQLKQINIAYALVKAHLAKHRLDPSITTTATPTHPHQGTTRRHDTPVGKLKKRSWIDHLFDALNAFAGNRGSEPPPSPAGENDTNRRKTFEQVLNEMAGGDIYSKQKRQSGNSAAAPRRPAEGYRRYRGSGGTVGAVAGKESPGPVKPVGRVRGIGRRR